MRSEKSDERVFESIRADDSGGMPEVRLQRNLSESKESLDEIPRVSTINPEDHLNLARKVAHSFSRFEEYDELVSICNLALVKAANKFDPSLGYEFSTYAYASMKNSVLKALKKKTRSKKSLQLDGDVEYKREHLEIDIPAGLSLNEETIFRLRLMDYNHSEIKERMCLSNTDYKKSLLSLRRKIEQKA